MEEEWGVCGGFVGWRERDLTYHFVPRPILEREALMFWAGGGVVCADAGRRRGAFNVALGFAA